PAAHQGRARLLSGSPRRAAPAAAGAVMLARVVTTLASFAILVVVFVPLERAFPARPGQRVLRPHLGVDALFFAGQYLLWSGVSLSVLAAVQGALASHVPALLPAGALPTWAVCAVAVVAGDLLVYAFHRACHAWEPLWRFHAVHH